MLEMDGLMEKAKKLLFSNGAKKGMVNKRLILFGIVGICLLVGGGLLDSYNLQDQHINKGTGELRSEIIPNRSYEDVLEAKLSNILSQLKGAGSVVVNITLENGSIQQHAKNITRESKTIQEKDPAGGIRTTTENKESEQILVNRENGTEHPVIVQEIKPSIKGVLVIAEGAYDSTVKANLTKAVETCLGVPSYKVTVLPERK
jgi:stage III sporulation protein AG